MEQISVLGLKYLPTPPGDFLRTIINAISIGCDYLVMMVIAFLCHMESLIYNLI
jgi:hypothetical protein